LSILGASETGLEQALQKAFSNADDDGGLLALQHPGSKVHVHRKRKKRKDYHFRRQFYEKPSIRPGCPGMSVGICVQGRLTANWIAWVVAVLSCSKM
jgi:hypothetical protein